MQTELAADPEKLLTGASHDTLVVHKPAEFIFRNPNAEELFHGIT